MATSRTKTDVPGIYRRGDTYTYVVTNGRNPVSERRRQRWVGFESIAAAESARAAELAAMSGVLTLRTFVEDRWLPLQLMRVRPGTMVLYRANWKRVTPQLADLTLAAITPLNLQNLYAELLIDGGRRGKPLSPRFVGS